MSHDDLPDENSLGQNRESTNEIDSPPTEQIKTSRREALKLGFIGLATSLPIARAFAAPEKNAKADKKPAKKKPYLFLTPQEALFVEAAVDRLIPADDEWGGAIAADVPRYIDLQLAGSWGAGERLYRSGPWREGTPSQGYQLPFTPAELFRTSLRALDRELAQKKTPFHKMAPGDQDAFLHELEKSDRDLDGVPARTFFEALLRSTFEGFFADPVYGGNKDMISWRMIGFPGASASYFEVVDKHGIKINRAPVSLAQDGFGKVHVNPNLPAANPGDHEHHHGK